MYCEPKHRGTDAHRERTGRCAMNAGQRVENAGLVHLTNRAGHAGPLLHELTMQRRPKRDVYGRAIRLGPTVTSAYQAARVLAPVLAFEATEVFGVLCLTAPRRVIGWYEVSRGSIDTVSAAPRDVFRMALLSNAAALILVHNRPSGDRHRRSGCRLRPGSPRRRSGLLHSALCNLERGFRAVLCFAPLCLPRTPYALGGLRLQGVFG
jgi:hypothetical protein